MPAQRAARDPRPAPLALPPHAATRPCDPFLGVQLWWPVVSAGRRTSTQPGLGTGQWLMAYDSSYLSGKELEPLGLAIEQQFEVGPLKGGGSCVRLHQGNRRAVLSAPTGPHPRSTSATCVPAVAAASLAGMCVEAGVEPGVAAAFAKVVCAIGDSDRHITQELLASSETSEVSPVSVPHHDARPDKPYQGKGNSPNSTRALAEEPGRGMARAGVRMGRYLLSLGPNLRWVLTVHELVDVWGVRLPVQPACEQRMAACGLLFGEWPAGHGHGGAPGYSDFYLCQPGAGGRIASGRSTHAHEMVWRLWREPGSAVFMDAVSASSGCEHGGSSQVPPFAHEAI